MDTAELDHHIWKAAFERLERGLDGRDNQAIYDICCKAGRYPFIPMATYQFDRQLRRAMDLLKPTLHSHKFCDVGCGIGSKLAIASAAGFQPYGIEIVPEYVKVARRVIDYGGGDIIEGDALVQDYSPYDCIYFYRPFADSDLERQLEQRIITTAKPGAIILANLKEGQADWWHDTKLVQMVEPNDNTIYRRCE